MFNQVHHPISLSKPTASRPQALKFGVLPDWAVDHWNDIVTYTGTGQLSADKPSKAEPKSGTRLHFMA